MRPLFRIIPTLFWLSLPAALVATPSVARGQFDDPSAPGPAAEPAPVTSGTSEIRDPAAMFSRDAVRENLARLVTIERTYRVPVTIETIESLRGETIDAAAVRMAKRLGAQAKGVYILMAKNDHKLDVLVSRDNTALNVRTRRLAIRDAFLDEFRKANGNFDPGLRKGVEAIDAALASIRAEEPRPPVVATTTPAARPPMAPSSGTILAPGGTPGSTVPVPEGAGAGLVRRGQVKLTLGGARRLLAAAEAKATAMGVKVNIAVVDDGGHLLAFSRMDDARPASVATALTKATTAATYRAPTGPLPGKTPTDAPDPLLNLSLQNASGGKITTLLGGIPVLLGGQVIGAVGVGGGTGEQDAEVAKAAVGAFLSDFEGLAVPAPK